MFKDTKTISAEYYGPQVSWCLDTLLDDINNDPETKKTYTKEDIENVWVKWNTLNIEFKDGYEYSDEGNYDWEIDTKRPKALYASDENGAYKEI